jgi:hypothetical protein
MQMLIDFELIPPEVANRGQIDKLNAVFDRLSARLVNQIKLPEPGSGFRASNLIRVYLQSHLRRMLQLSEAALTEFFDGRGIVAILCARGLYEGLATVADFEKELQVLLKGGDLERIFQFTKEKAHATKMKDWIQKTGNQNVTAKNVVTMVEKLKTIRSNIPREYDFLSEIAHPNGAGAFGFFASMSNPEDVAYFSESGPDPQADLQWVLVASSLLSQFEAVMDRVEAELPALSALRATNAPKNEEPPLSSL